MNITILLAGLTSENVSKQLQQLEHLLQGLSGTPALEILQSGCEDCLQEIREWAALRPAAKPDTQPRLFLACAAAKHAAMAMAASKELPCHTEALALSVANGAPCVHRKVYSAHLEGVFPGENAVTIASGACATAAYTPVPEADAATGRWDIPTAPGIFLQTTPLEIKEDLSKARLVLLGGKGLGSKENFQRMEALARKLGAASACTRPVALSGWAGYDKVTGISGWRLQAEVCLAFGVSGAAPLLAGLENVKQVIAINNDKSAPIFRAAQKGVLADCTEILAAMEALTGD